MMGVTVVVALRVVALNWGYGADLSAYRDAVVAVNAGVNPYVVHTHMNFVYPPSFLILMGWMSGLSDWVSVMVSHLEGGHGHLPAGRQAIPGGNWVAVGGAYLAVFPGGVCLGYGSGESIAARIAYPHRVLPVTKVPYVGGYIDRNSGGD